MPDDLQKLIARSRALAKEAEGLRTRYEELKLKIQATQEAHETPMQTPKRK